MTASHATGVCAIVPAAGQSRRMGRAKQQLDVSGRTLLEAILEPLVQSQLQTTVLVTSSDIAQRIDAGKFSGLSVVINDDQQSHMIDSLRLGIATLAGGGPGFDGLLVCPCDQPGLHSGDIDACIDFFRKHSQDIIVATYQGKRGHPLLFPAAMIEQVKSTVCDSGLNMLLKHHASRVREVALDSPAVIRNINTPEDYEQLTRSESD